MTWDLDLINGKMIIGNRSSLGISKETKVWKTQHKRKHPKDQYLTSAKSTRTITNDVSNIAI